MGLAASQARFLNLTARKTNIEYEGQQINQQRTTLANQSASYYNSMLTLSVPTPPSTESYKTTVYTCTYAGNTYTFNQVTGKDSNATISWTYSAEEYVAQKIGTTNLNKVGDDYTFNGLKLVQGKTQVGNIANNILEEMKAATGNQALTAEDIYYTDKQNGSSHQYTYFLKSEVDEKGVDAPVDYYRQADKTTYNSGVWTEVSITRDANNRIAALSGGKQDGKALNFDSIAIKTSQVTDNDAYNDAYNEYTYKNYLYQQQMEEINAQTSVIQAQDKKLELRLKQLDTEQNAISTEMESISSVIDKNVEKTFNTFG